jgi:DNA-binding NarL/FixJ family response regulator
MKRDILLIEGDDQQRVALVRALLRASFRVTVCSSLEEADEVLRYVDCPQAAPDTVLFGGRIAHRAMMRFEKALLERFRAVRIVRLPERCEPRSVAAMLSVPAASLSGTGAEQTSASARSLSVLLIEGNRDHRAAIEDDLRLKGDDVVGCDSVGEAAMVFDRFIAQGLPVDAVVSATGMLDGDGLRFCASATSRMPDLRWILLKEPARLGTPLPL